MTEVKPPAYIHDSTLKRDYAIYGQHREPTGMHPGDELKSFRPTPTIYDAAKALQQPVDVLPPCISVQSTPSSVYRCRRSSEDLIEVPEEEMVSLAAEHNGVLANDR